MFLITSIIYSTWIQTFNGIRMILTHSKNMVISLVNLLSVMKLYSLKQEWKLHRECIPLIRERQSQLTLFVQVLRCTILEKERCI